MSIHKQMCKKIAQLTKVVHRLNTINQEHERDLHESDKLHQEELVYIATDAEDKLAHLRAELDAKDGIVEQLSRAKERIRCDRKKEMTDYDSKLDKVAGDLRHEYRVKVDSMEEDYKNIEELLKQQTHDFEVRVKEMQCRVGEHQSDFRSQCKSIATGYDETISSNKANHDHEKGEIKAQQKREMAKLVSLHNREKDDWKKESSSELEALRIKINSDYESQMRAIANDYKYKVALSGHCIQELEVNVTDLVSKMELKEAELRRCQESAREDSQRQIELERVFAKEVQNGIESIREEKMKQNELHMKLGEKEKALARNDEELRRYRIEIEDDKDESSKRIASITLKLREGEHERDALQSQLREESKLREELKWRDEKIEEDHREIQDLKEALGHTNGTTQSMGETIKDYQMKQNELHMKLGEKEKALARNDGELRRYRIEIEDDKDKSSKRIASITLKLREGEQERDALQSQLREELKWRDGQIEEDHRAIQDLKEALGHTNGTTQSMWNSVKDYQAVVMGLKKTNSDLKKDCIDRLADAKLNIVDTKETISRQLSSMTSSMTSNINDRLREVQETNLREVLILKQGYSQTLKDMIQEHDQSSCQKESNHRASTMALQLKIEELEKGFAVAAERVRHQTHWETTLEAERAQQQKREESFTSEHNFKWEKRVALLKVSHEEQMQRLRDEMLHDRHNHEQVTRTLNENHHNCIEEVWAKLDTLKGNHEACLISHEELKKENTSLEIRVREICHVEQMLRSQTSRLQQKEAEAQSQMENMRAQLKYLTSEVASIQEEKERRDVSCSSLRLQLVRAQEKIARISESHLMTIVDIQCKNEEGIRCLEEQFKNRHQNDEAILKKTRAELVSELTVAQNRIDNLTSIVQSLNDNTKRSQNELDAIKIEHAESLSQMQRETNQVVVEIHIKEDESKKRIRKFYDKQISQLESKLLLTASELETSIVQSRIVRRDRNDIERISTLENELLESKTKERKLASEMVYYKSELKNREVNFNSRFTATNNNVGVLSTFKRPSTSGSKAYGKQNKRALNVFRSEKGAPKSFSK